MDHSLVPQKGSMEYEEVTVCFVFAVVPVAAALYLGRYRTCPCSLCILDSCSMYVSRSCCAHAVFLLP